MQEEKLTTQLLQFKIYVAPVFQMMTNDIKNNSWIQLDLT